MDFKLFSTAVTNLMAAIQGSAVASVRALKAHTFDVRVINAPKSQKVHGEVKVNQDGVLKEVKALNSPLTSIIGLMKSLKFPESIKVSNFPEFPKPITEIRVSNFPKAQDFPKFPKEFKILNPEISELKGLSAGIDTLTGEIKKLKLDPKITVEAPKPERVVVPPANVTVTQQEINYKKLAEVIGEQIPDFDYKKFAQVISDSVNISVSGGGGGKYSFKNADGSGATALVDSDRHVQVDVVTNPMLSERYDLSVPGEVYEGFAVPGTNPSEPKWLIKKTDLTTLITTFAGGSRTFNAIWDNHTVLSYS